MAAFLLVVVLYALGALVLTMLLHGDWQQTLTEFALIASSISRNVFDTQAKALILALPLVVWYARNRSAINWWSFVQAIFAAILLQIGFFFVKSAIPHIVPFYADPFLADLEWVLLFGRDAWELSHAVTPDALAAWFPTIYSSMWSILAVVFPILVVASDTNAARSRRFLWLYLLTWVVAGNILALAVSSVGPVYYDQLLGTDRFEAMRVSFDVIGYSSGGMAEVQEMLWDHHGGRISFISAFPSMHVAITVVAAIYLWERFRRFAWLGAVYFALILLISVYSGYHYLLDGLASVVIVLALNTALRWLDLRQKHQQEGPTRSDRTRGRPGEVGLEDAERIVHPP